jgi:hypothetical protein
MFRLLPFLSLSLPLSLVTHTRHTHTKRRCTQPETETSSPSLSCCVCGIVGLALSELTYSHRRPPFPPFSPFFHSFVRDGLAVGALSFVFRIRVVETHSFRDGGGPKKPTRRALAAARGASSTKHSKPAPNCRSYLSFTPYPPSRPPHHITSKKKKRRKTPSLLLLLLLRHRRPPRFGWLVLVVVVRWFTCTGRFRWCRAARGSCTRSCSVVNRKGGGEGGVCVSVSMERGGRRDRKCVRVCV